MRVMTVSSEYVRLLLAGLVADGHDPEPLLKEHDLNPKLLTHCRLRAPAAKFGRLAQSTKLFLQDETLGLLSRPQKIGTHAWMARACLSARTVGESFASWSNGIDLGDNAMRSVNRFDQNESMLAIEFETRPGVRSDYVIASSFALAHRFHCWLSNDFLPIARIEFDHPAPSHVDAYQYLFYGAPVIFDAPRNAIYLEKSSLDLPNARAVSDFEDIYGDFHARLLAQSRKGSSVSVKVRLLLESQLRAEQLRREFELHCFENAGCRSNP